MDLTVVFLDTNAAPETLMNEAIDNVIKERNVSFLPVRNSFITKRTLDSKYISPPGN